MGKLKSAINWFEISATDFERAVRFYSQIYAFEMPTRDYLLSFDALKGN